jgi:hypothetical protein
MMHISPNCFECVHGHVPHFLPARHPDASKIRCDHPLIARLPMACESRLNVPQELDLCTMFQPLRS